MSQTPLLPNAPDGTVLETYLAGWARLNRAIRRGDSWSGFERNAAFLNGGQRGGRFAMADVAPALGLDMPDDGRSAARLDVDFDGDEDIVVSNRTEPRLRVLQNRLADGAVSIAVTTQGRTCNREGLGAVVFATPVSDDAGPVEPVPGVTQRRTRTAGAGYLAQSSQWLRFSFPPSTGGSRRAPRVQLSVRWPGSNLELESFGVVRSGRRYVLEQGTGVARESVAPAAVDFDAGELTGSPLGYEGLANRFVLPSPTAVPSIEVAAAEDRAGRVFGVTPAGPRGFGRPMVLVAWDPSDPEGIAGLGNLGALSTESEAGGATLLAVDAGDGDAVARIQTAATRLQANGWSGQSVAAVGEGATILAELVRWRTDREKVPPLPWSFVFQPDGRLAILRLGAWQPGALARDLELLESPPALRPTVATAFPGAWANPPQESDLARIRLRLEELGAGSAVRELDLARVSTVAMAGPDVQIRLGRSHLDNRDPDSALGRFEAAIQLEPGNVLAHRGRAYALHLLGRFDEALEAWGEALRLDPADLDTRGNRAMAAIAAGKFGIARGDIDVLEARAGKESPVAVAVRDALAIALAVERQKEGAGTGDVEDGAQPVDVPAPPKSPGGG